MYCRGAGEEGGLGQGAVGGSIQLACRSGMILDIRSRGEALKNA
jgi:hypothetical protein